MPPAKTLYLALGSADSTLELGSAFGELLSGRMTFALCGQLGTGKTTFTQGLALGLGVEEEVTSPSFTMLHEYHSGRLPLYHVDLYRLQEDLAVMEEAAAGAAGLLQAELEEVMQSQAVLVVEWVELWPDLVGNLDRVLVVLTYDEGSGRRAELSGLGSQAEDLLRRLQLQGRLDWVP